MSNLDKLRAKNKAAQEMKAQNQAKKSENLVDDIIQSGISYEEASGDDSQNVNQIYRITRKTRSLIFGWSFSFLKYEKADPFRICLIH